MMGAVAGAERVVVRLCGEERFHALHLKFHFDIGGKFGRQLFHRIEGVLLRVQGGTYRCEKVGVLRVDDMGVVQLQRADERLL